jgi:hypothetical protein
MTARVRASSSKPREEREPAPVPIVVTPPLRGRSPTRPRHHYPETGHRIRYLLRTHGWRQRQLAWLCGRTEGCVCNWAAGRSRPRTTDLEVIAKEFSVSIDWLLGSGKLKGTE